MRNFSYTLTAKQQPFWERVPSAMTSGPATSDVCATPSRSGICPVEGGELVTPLREVAESGWLMATRGESCFKQTNGRF